MKVSLRLKPYIQPFEKRLALLELASLAGARPKQVNRNDRNALDYEVESAVSMRVLAERLSYWESVSTSNNLYTSQALLEATTNVFRNGIKLSDIEQHLPFNGNAPLPNRRCLRYGTHGLHEYRGKFFPQLVRALTNVAGVQKGGVVVDPMCGSGTAVVESMAGGFKGLGADINPLSVFMSRTKAALLRADPRTIMEASERVRGELSHRSKKSDARMPSHLAALPVSDKEYLSNWFSEPVLHDLDRIASAIRSEPEGCVRDLFFLSLSNILRSVSWQKKDDLRVRREVRSDSEAQAIKEFLEDLERSVGTLLPYLYQLDASGLGDFEVREADAREIPPGWEAYKGRVDAAITSPPYATALPYLDTDRLSLCFLSLLPRPAHRKRDFLMIGNREITERGRRDYWYGFLDARSELPPSIVKLIERIQSLNSAIEVGFRRRNLPALLAKYFLDMQKVLANLRVLLKPHGSAFIVIGNNSTTAGGQKVSIQTSDLLADLAARNGFRVKSVVPMEMLISRDIFRKNTMNSEVILHLTRR